MFQKARGLIEFDQAATVSHVAARIKADYFPANGPRTHTACAASFLEMKRCYLRAKQKLRMDIARRSTLMRITAVKFRVAKDAGEPPALRRICTSAG